MGIIVSTSCLEGYSYLSDLVLDLLTLELRNIELSASPMLKKDEIFYLYGLNAKFNVHNYFPPVNPPFTMNLASCESRILDLSINLAKQAIDLTAAFSSSFYTVHAGVRTEINPASLGGRLVHGPIVPYDTAFEQLVRSLRYLCDYGRPRGITICIEPQVVTCENLINGNNDILLICDYREVENLIRSVERKNFGILLDTGHLAVNAATLKFDRYEYIDEVAQYIVAFHVHDNDSVEDQHLPITSKSWIADILRRSEFTDLPIIIEAKFRTPIELRQHVDWLKGEFNIT